MLLRVVPQDKWQIKPKKRGATVHLIACTHMHTEPHPVHPRHVTAALIVTFPAVNIGPVSSHLVCVYQHST